MSDQQHWVSNPIAPWHMWGSQLIVVAPIVADGGATTTQMARVSYRRPENWRFFFGARLIDVPTQAVGDPALTIYVKFDLIIGIGRAMTIVKSVNVPADPDGIGTLGFANFTFLLGAPLVSTPRLLKWASSVRQPLEDDFLDRVEGDPVDHFPAQDIQCSARVMPRHSTVTGNVTVELSAYFAPNVHVRPDWFVETGDLQVQRQHQFTGTETGGT